MVRSLRPRTDNVRRLSNLATGLEPLSKGPSRAYYPALRCFRSKPAHSAVHRSARRQVWLQPSQWYPAVLLSIYAHVKPDELRALGASLFGRTAQ